MPKKVLLIDDDEDEIDIFNAALHVGRPDARLRYFDGVNALLKVKLTTRPDYIFIDMNMPEINGLEGIRKIKETEDLCSVPIVLYSQGLDEKLCRKGLETGASFGLKKLSAISELSNRLIKIFTSTEYKKCFY